jgi:transposase-like protein
MPGTRQAYPLEFRREAVALVRSGAPLKQVAAELGVSEQTLRNWHRQVTSTPGIKGCSASGGVATDDGPAPSLDEDEIAPTAVAAPKYELEPSLSTVQPRRAGRRRLVGSAACSHSSTSDRRTTRKEEPPCCSRLDR